MKKENKAELNSVHQRILDFQIAMNRYWDLVVDRLSYDIYKLAIDCKYKLIMWEKERFFKYNKSEFIDEMMDISQQGKIIESDYIRYLDSLFKYNAKITKNNGEKYDK